MAEMGKPSRRRKPRMFFGQDIQGPRIREHKAPVMELFPEIKHRAQK